MKNYLNLGVGVALILASVAMPTSTVVAADCVKPTAEEADLGPWESESTEHRFYFVPGKMSWWKAVDACKELRGELPTKKQIRENFIYLNGTSPIGDLLRRQEGCLPYNYPNAELWTREREPNYQAWTFNPYFPKHTQTFQMDSRFAVLCIQ